MLNPKNAIFCFVIVIVGLFSYLPPSWAVEVKGLRFGMQKDVTRMVLDLTTAADFTVSLADNPMRVRVDLPPLPTPPSVKKSTLPASVSDIHYQTLSPNVNRLSVFITKPMVVRAAYVMPAEGQKPARLVIDLKPADDAAFKAALAQTFGTLNDKGTGKQKTKDKADSKKKGDTKAPLASADKPLIMLDAGHGGQDPGAVGANMVAEKNITLGVAKALGEALEASGRYRVALTRDNDVFIPLHKRVDIARNAGASLFLSIHADSVNQSNVSGASIYTLSDKASDAQTERLAARENEADLIADVKLPTEDRETAEILIDLAMRETTGHSKAFANNLVQSLEEGGIALLDDPHRHAGFMVLLAPDMPSALLELGFVSNPVEAERLMDPTHRTRLVQAIMGGIDAYFATTKARQDL